MANGVSENFGGTHVRRCTSEPTPVLLSLSASTSEKRIPFILVRSRPSSLRMLMSAFKFSPSELSSINRYPVLGGTSLERKIT
ncbi:hypothetical protein M3J09_006185 [Ascochyta lentis]